MKIFNNNSVYVQKNDIAYLNQTDLAFPASIYTKVFGHGVTIIDNSNRYEFVEYKEPHEIEFFRSQSWIVDYDDVKDLTEEEIIKLGKSIAEERNQIAREYNKLSKAKRKKQYAKSKEETELLEYKMYSLRDMIMFKKEELQFELPAGVQKTVFIEQKEEIEPVPVQITHEPQETGIKKFIKKILNNK